MAVPDDIIMTPASKQGSNSVPPLRILLAVLSVAVAIFMAVNHDFVSMWVEGLPEYESLILAVLGYAEPTAAANQTLPLSGRALPLGLNAYTGAFQIYLDMPAAYVWLKGISQDPYCYRYGSIFVLLLSAWLFYSILKHSYGSTPAFFGAATLLLCPTQVLIALTDHRAMLSMGLVILAALHFALKYAESKSRINLALCGLFFGLTLWTRTEAFLFLALSSITYGVFFNAKHLRSWLSRLPSGTVALFTASFLLGASPFLAYNLRSPEQRIWTFFLSNTLHSVGWHDVWQKAAIRLDQFVTFLLLNKLAFYELLVPNIGLLVAFCSAVVILIRTRRKVKLSVYPFYALCLLLPLFVLGRRDGEPRELHLILLQPLVIATVVAAAARISSTSRSYTASAILALMTIGSAITTASDYLHWRSLPPSSITMLNLGDPPALVSYLAQHHQQDDIVYTNIGLPQYVQYVSRNRIRGRDIMNWFSFDAFDDELRQVLLNKARRRVFVATPEEHDGHDGTLARTRRLDTVLSSHHVPYQRIRLSDSRNTHIYDLFIVEPGVGLDSLVDASPRASAIEIQGVGMNPPQNGALAGTIYGKNFKDGDTVVVNGKLAFSSAFGSSRFITFMMPAATVKGQQAFEVRVVRTSTMEASSPFVVKILSK